MPIIPDSVKAEEYSKIINSDLRRATLCFLVKDDQILLAMKKRGFGVGRWNGVGGKVKPPESVEDAMVRETSEEIGVTPREFRKVAELDFYFYNEEHKLSPIDQRVAVYFCHEWEGEPSESEEMAPKWYSKSELPFASMWPDDKIWLPKVISGQFVNAIFLFGKGDAIIDCKVDGT